MIEEIIKELKKDKDFKKELKDIDLEKIIVDILKDMLKENKENFDINKGKAEIHIEKEDLNVATKMSGNPVILISLLGMALKEIQNKNNISDDEVKKIMDCSHTFGREDM